MDDWQKIGQTVKRIGFRMLVFKNYKLPDGIKKEFTSYGKHGAQDVAMIALTPDNKVVIARQFRPGPEQVLDELPGGSVDPGEDLATAAKRELTEETGYIAEKLDYLGLAFRDAYNNATSHYFIAYGCTKTVQQALEESEFVEVNEISIKQLIDNACNGKMTDAPAVIMAYKPLLRQANFK